MDSHKQKKEYMKKKRKRKVGGTLGHQRPADTARDSLIVRSRCGGTDRAVNALRVGDCVSKKRGVRQKMRAMAGYGHKAHLPQRLITQARFGWVTTGGTTDFHRSG